MPFYELKCLRCGHEKSIISSFKNRIRKCEKCGATMTVKPSVTAIKFRGYGFHGTDYTSTGPKNGIKK